MKQSQTFWLQSLRALGAASLLGLAAGAQASEVSDGVSGVSLAEVRTELKALPADMPASMTRAQMTQFISNLLVDRRIEKAAMAAGTANLPGVRASIAKATRNVVVSAYVDGETKKLAQTLPDLEGLAKERYEVNKATYVLPEGVRVAHILFRVNEENPQSLDQVVRSKAEKILAELRNGVDFGGLAREYSEDHVSARNKGELPGWSNKGTLVPSFEEAAYALKPDEVSGLVRSRFGYHIIKLLEKREVKQRTFDEVKQHLLTGLRNDFLGTKRAEWMKVYQGANPIVLDDATLEALRMP